MAAFFGLLSSHGFLWFQLAIFIWQAIRPAATMRIPWALVSSAVYKIFGGKKLHDEYYILLLRDYNDTADRNKFYEESKGIVSERALDNSSVEFHYKNSRYICSAEKASQIRLLIAGELRTVPIINDHKIVNGLMRILSLCSADEAIRMCLSSKRFRLSFRKKSSVYLIERMPLITNTYWLSKVLGGIPLYLSARGSEQLSSILTLVLIILDFTYNIWVPAIEKAYLMFVRCVQLLLSNLSPNLRIWIFYLLSNFDYRYLPCSIIDFKVKIKRTRVFYTTENAVLKLPVEPSIKRVSIDDVDINQSVYRFQSSAFRVHIAITTPPSPGSDMVEFELWLRDVLYDVVKVTYSMTLHNFKTYIRCWDLLEKGNIGLVQTLDDGLIMKSMHLFGFEETINLFLGSNVNIFQVQVPEEYSYLIAGKNEECVNFPALDSPMSLAVVRSWGGRLLSRRRMRHRHSSAAD